MPALRLQLQRQPISNCELASSQQTTLFRPIPQEFLPWPISLKKWFTLAQLPGIDLEIAFPQNNCSKSGSAKQVLAAKELEETRKTSGFEQSALDQAAQQGFNNGAFEDSEENTSAIVEEFFPALEDQHNHIELHVLLAVPDKPSLAQKLEPQASRHKYRPSAP